MSDFDALANAVRDHYLAALVESLGEFRALNDPSSPEVLLEMRNEKPLAFRLYRADMAANVGGELKVQDVNPSTHLSFDPFTVEFAKGSTGALHPFVWNDIGIQVDVTLPANEVEDWALRWLDAEDESTQQDEHGLSQVIHSVLRDDIAGGGTLLNVDFGSAPVAALRELIDLALAAGASHLSIHSSMLSSELPH